MMTTDSERREVARRLRELRPGACFDDVYEAFGAYGPSPYESRVLSATGLARRLADLIEPATSDAERSANVQRTFGNEGERSDCDRAALLALADKMEGKANDWDVTQGDVPLVHAGHLLGYADRIREALGVVA